MVIEFVGFCACVRRGTVGPSQGPSRYLLFGLTFCILGLRSGARRGWEGRVGIGLCYGVRPKAVRGNYDKAKGRLGLKFYSAKPDVHQNPANTATYRTERSEGSQFTYENPNIFA
ncbi:hypothetical protein GGTG_04813 [Gaeumannomyces tritici R3-111a-1]|uniref:Uncharacterized protein n=1 Tax=Gaeumannomyces tritici (strain R3-111a-1) TaxID=644352 RepID=J3NU58_GAET3|nr:hypothetical protein GGTG_04813 [Gaeumannomyces tritici R3-111a-1]EJT79729.1 hypothetical protein GGTG_04813 [Gaeumannomyces tritici R3-111a-1]